MQKKLYYTQILFNNKIKNRNLFILPEYINQLFYIYNGKSYVQLKIIDEMVGYQFKNFIITKKRSIFKKKK